MKPSPCTSGFRRERSRVRSSLPPPKHSLAGAARSPNSRRRLARQDRCELHRRRISEIKISEGCLFCGALPEEVLQFHHRDPAQKLTTISGGFLCKSWEVVAAELEKCVVLCANCHHQVHAGTKHLPEE